MSNGITIVFDDMDAGGDNRLAFVNESVPLNKQFSQISFNVM